MKYINTFLLSTVVLFFSCGNENTSIDAQTKTEIKFDKTITTKDLIELLNNIDNEEYLTTKLDSHDFRKKFNGVYTSIETVANTEPTHWIHVTDMGKISRVSISTAEQETWERLLNELESFATPEQFEDETSDKAQRYIGQAYTFKSYEPENGINLSLNELYQIYVLRTKNEKQ